MSVFISILFLSSFFGSDTVSDNKSGYPMLSYEDLKKEAKSISIAPYKARKKILPKWLRDMTYDDLRNVRFNSRKAVWRSERLPFQLQFFHPGCIQTEQIRVHLVSGNEVETVPFEQDLFEYCNGLKSEPLGPDIAFSGFRIHYPLNRQDYLDELMVFQGATYFRALAQGLNYGISSRTIAINPSEGGNEEFPSFTDFWIFRPDKNDTSLHVMGLFDSPSIAGAADFLIKPGSSTVIDINVFICSRKNDPVYYGIAPLRSMFWYGENSSVRWGDFRPEVHDSDGLMIHTSADQWIWRPLSNDGVLKKSFFEDKKPKGFGLFQRDRRFSSYRDLEAKYHERPSVWIEPQGEWGEGYISLLETPSSSEYNDNISVVWFPKEPLSPKSSAEFKYKQIWFLDNRSLPAIGKTAGTYVYQPAGSPPETRKFIIEFYWPDVQADINSGTLDIHTVAENAIVRNKHGDYNSYENTYRIFFDADVQDKLKPVELKVDICREGRPLTETWTYQWTP